jgi:hypothetical protein
MAGIGISLEKIIVNSANALANLQIGVNKVLWGSANTQPQVSAKYNPTSGSLEYTVTPALLQSRTPQDTQTALSKVQDFSKSGIYNTLDALNAVDLCSVITYAYDTINVKKKPRDPNAQGPQKALYDLQDQAFTVQTVIDRYTALPNVLVGSYIGTNPTIVTNQQAVTDSGAPSGSNSITGNNVEKFNLFNLILAIQDILQREQQSASGSLFTPEEKQLLALVPGLAGNVNFIDDFLGYVQKYTDYRNITNEDLIKLQRKVSQVRAACVTIQNLNIKSGAVLVGNFLGVDIRSQIQQLSKFVNPTRIIPTLKRINDSIRSFIRIATKVQNVLRQMQFIIKLALLFIKILRFIQTFFTTLPLPSLFTTVGVQQAFSKAREAAQTTTGDLVKLLKEVNALLGVVLIFVRYLLANANELLIRLDGLLLSLEGCEATKDSDVLRELRATRDSLVELRDQLGAYITQYDSKTNPDTAFFAEYQIKVIDEEVTERSIVNKRRRGIALDKNGFIVTQSDLTFATNTQVIIEEVKVKLISAGLVQPSFAIFEGQDLAVISTSLDYLDSNDVLQDDLNIETLENLDTPDNEDESKGTGLNAFINKLPGGRRLRRRTRAALNSASQRLATQVAGEGEAGRSALNVGSTTAQFVGTGNEPETQTERQRVTGRRNR